MDKEYLYNNTLDKYQNEDFINFVTQNRNHYFKDREVEMDLEKLLKEIGELTHIQKCLE